MQTEPEPIELTHVDLRVIERGIDLRASDAARPAPALPGLRQADIALCVVARALKTLWADAPGKPVRIGEIEADPRTRTIAVHVPWALKRLQRMNQVSIDFDRDVTLIAPGRAWIENVAAASGPQADPPSTHGPRPLTALARRCD